MRVLTEVVVPLSVRDLTHADLPCCEWAGVPPHLDYVATALDRACAGEVDYLAVCGPTDLPLGIGGVDYTARRGVGTLWQLVVHPALRSCGIGTLLIRAAEDRIRACVTCTVPNWPWSTAIPGPVPCTNGWATWLAVPRCTDGTSRTRTARWRTTRPGAPRWARSCEPGPARPDGQARR